MCNYFLYIQLCPFGYFHIHHKSLFLYVVLDIVLHSTCYHIVGNILRSCLTWHKHPKQPPILCVDFIRLFIVSTKLYICSNQFSIFFSYLYKKYFSQHNTYHKNTPTTYNILLQIYPKYRLHLADINGIISVSDQVAETCDACDRKEDLRAFLFLYKNIRRKKYAKETN